MKKEKMMETICEEIDKIADKGLTTGNLDTAYKLIDMYKDLKTVDAMEDSEYSETMAYDENGSSYKRDSKGRYSREEDKYSRYMDRKKDYRYSRTSDNKRKILDSLDDYMNELTEKLDNMMRDAETQEEKHMIQKYIDRIRE